MKTFLKNNINYFIFLIFAIILELVSLFIMVDTFFISKPWLMILLLGGIFCICNLIKSKKVRNTFLLVLYIIQIIINLFCVILYDNTGTLFDFSMIQLAGEALEFSGTVVVNFWYVVFAFGMLLTYVLFCYFFNKYEEDKYSCKLVKIISSICLGSFVLSYFGITFSENRISEKKFINSLYSDTSDKYSTYGPTINFFNEISKMIFFNDYDKLSNEEINEYIYKETNTHSPYFGVSKDNNLITILVESFEWFAFVSDSSVYPNGANLSEEVLDQLYPNIRAFYNMSVIMNNHYSENKTDISEDEALLGIYPSSNYINYTFENNTYVSSLSKVLALFDSTIENNFFHNNNADFYNREKVVTSLGYNNLYFIDEMSEKGVTDYMNGYLTNDVLMNLDSEMFAYMKDEMFPTDKRFNTHITTVSMHGNYVYRKNMQKWLDKMNSLNVYIENDYLRNYMAAVMEFDCALGIMLDDLKEKDLLDKTTIVIFSDHNAYMSNLSGYVKNIYDYSHPNYNELYRLPLMIYDNNLGHKIIDKFTTTYDITPTILDLFGINYYSNLYYGNCIFNDDTSILYSKAFDVFMTDKILFSNINNPLYKKDINDEYLNIIEEKSIALLKKIYYTNHLFHYNYFNNKNNYQTYLNNYTRIN